MPAPNQPTEKCLYVSKVYTGSADAYNKILGSTVNSNPTAVNRLLAYAYCQGYTTLFMYEMGNYISGNTFTAAGKAIFRDFIPKAKLRGINIVGVTNTSLNQLKAFEDYNNTCASNVEKFTGIITENEWWWWSFNNAAQGPNGEYSFTVMKNTLNAEKANLTAAGLQIYAYVGWARANGYVYSGTYLNQGVIPLDNSVVTGGNELAQLQGIIDKFGLHDYTVNDQGSLNQGGSGISASDGAPFYSYMQTRCSHFTAPVNVFWIVSSEEDFSGPWFEGKGNIGAPVTYFPKDIVDAYQYISILIAGASPPQAGSPLHFNAEPSATIQANVNVIGIANFIYRTMVDTTYKRISKNGNRIWVDAGPDITIPFGAGVPLSGTYGDDLLPNNATYTITWSIQSGPGGASVLPTNSLTPTFNYTTAGTYLVRLLVNDGFTTSLNELTIVVQAVASTLTISLAGTDIACNGAATGVITATVTGGTAPYTYSWSGPGGGFPNSPVISSLVSGAYTVVVTDAVGGTIADSIFLSQPTALVVTPTATDTTCFAGKDGTALVTVSGGTAPYTYSWNSFPPQTTALATNLTPGNYTCTVTDANGCVQTGTTTVGQPTALTVTMASVAATCGLSDGQASATPAGGSGFYTYLWSTGATTSAITGLAQGTYTCVVTDTAGCRVSSPTIVGSGTGPTVSIVLDSNVSCAGGNDGGAHVIITVGTVGPYTYSWSDGQTTVNAVNLVAGTYTVAVTDANGCKGIDTITITQPAILTLGFTVTNDSCDNSIGAITTSVAGGTAPYAYLWNTGAVTADISSLSGGTYTCTVTDIEACQVTLSVTVLNTQSPTLAVASSTTGPCSGYSNGTITVTASGGVAPYTYSWDSGGVLATETGLSAGTYTCTVTDRNGCTGQISHTLLPIAPLSIILDSTEIPCSGTGITINALVSGGQPGYAYFWSTGETTQRITVFAGGNYSVTVFDAGGCTTGDVISIGAATSPSLTLTPSAPVCSGSLTGSITASVTSGVGPYTYSWTGPSGFTSTLQNLTNVATGAYTCTVTDQNLCTDVKSATVIAYELPVISGVVRTPLCPNDNDGSIDITVTGGVVPYTYAWSNGSILQDLIGVPAGSYSVTVTDANGCRATAAYVLTNPTPITATLQVTQIPIGETTGGAILITTVSGGTAPYDYDWSTGDTGVTSINNLGEGTYTVTITDANGCQIILTRILSVKYQYQVATLRAKCCMADLAYTVTKAERYGRDDLWCLKLKLKYMRLAVCLLDRYASDNTCISDEDAANVLEQLNKICGCCECDFTSRVFDDTL